MNTIQIEDKPIALILQIDPNTHQVFEMILKTEYTFEGHSGVRDIWFRNNRLEDREAAQFVVDAAIKDLIG